jgi:hypothetical protein
MDILSVEKLPFYDEEKHDIPSEGEQRKQAEAYGAYLKISVPGTNLKRISSS